MDHGSGACNFWKRNSEGLTDFQELSMDLVIKVVVSDV
jgi:hypothetical protein